MLVSFGADLETVRIISIIGMLVILVLGVLMLREGSVRAKAGGPAAKLAAKSYGWGTGTLVTLAVGLVVGVIQALST
jgi:hypothetical protein